mmetsp:Transcript_42610/g.40885  ORF Transcript_42610/g.40885 Transcript_42610/m.40885 type:complete len:104 (-) Transcript_42610:942-1253(-)
MQFEASHPILFILLAFLAVFLVNIWTLRGRLVLVGVEVRKVVELTPHVVVLLFLGVQLLLLVDARAEHVEVNAHEVLMYFETHHIGLELLRVLFGFFLRQIEA